MGGDFLCALSPESLVCKIVKSSKCTFFLSLGVNKSGGGFEGEEFYFLTLKIKGEWKEKKIMKGRNNINVTRNMNYYCLLDHIVE